MPDVIKDNGTDFAQYRSGKFTFTAMGTSVMITHDNKSVLPQTTACYDYKNWDDAADAAWKMACKQMKA